MNTSKTHSKEDKQEKQQSRKLIMRTLSGERFHPSSNAEIRSDDCTPNLGTVNGNANKQNSDSNIDFLYSPTGCIQSMGQASIKSRFEYTGNQQLSYPENKQVDNQTQSITNQWPYSRMVNLSFKDYLPSNPIGNLSGMVHGSRYTHQKKLKEINDRKRKEIQNARNQKDNSYNSTKRVMGDFVIEDYQDTQLDEGLTMPLIMENSDEPNAEVAVLEQPKPKEKLLLSHDEEEQPDEEIVPLQSDPDPQEAALSLPYNDSICGEVTPTKEIEPAQEKFPLVSMRKQMQQNITQIKQFSPTKYNIDLEERDEPRTQSYEQRERKIVSEKGKKQEILSVGGQNEALEYDQENSESFRIKPHHKVQKFIQIVPDISPSDPAVHNENYDSNFDFLNQQELDSLQKLNPHKSSRRHNQSDQSSILGSQIFNRGKNSDSGEMGPLSPAHTISSNSQDRLKEMLKCLKIQQQGTSISIFNVNGQEHKNRLRQILNENQVVPSRTLDLEENREMILFLLSKEESDNVMKLLQDRGFKTIDPYSQLEQVHATTSLDSMNQQSFINSADKPNENNCSYLRMLDNSGFDKNKSQIVNKTKDANILIKTESTEKEHADQRKRTNSQTTIMQMFKYPHTSIRKQEIFKEAHRDLHRDEIFDAKMELPGSLKLSGIQNQQVSDDERLGLRIQSCGESSTFANHEGMTSHSMLNNKKENSFNLLRPTRNGVTVKPEETRILNKSADMHVSAKHDSHFDSESTENFSYIMPTTQMPMENNIEKQFAQLNLRSTQQHQHMFSAHLGGAHAFGQAAAQQHHALQQQHAALLHAQVQQQSQYPDYNNMDYQQNSIFNNCPYQHPIGAPMSHMAQSQASYSGQAFGPGIGNHSQQDQQRPANQNPNIIQQFIQIHQQLPYQPPTNMYQQYTSFVPPPVNFQPVQQQQQQWQQQFQQYQQTRPEQQLQAQQHFYQAQQQVHESAAFTTTYPEPDADWSNHHYLGAITDRSQSPRGTDQGKDPDCPFEFQTEQEMEAEAKDEAKNYSSQAKENDGDPSKDEKEEANGSKQSNYKKKVLVGPKCNQIDFERIINSQVRNDTEIERQTTLMIRNIPIKFSQPDMLKLFDEKFQGQYNYFYLPKDLKTQCGQGFAFINFVHPIFILDFYLEFNCIKWSEKIEKCNSNKYCQITYANVQGIEDIKAELSDKNIMKKTEGNVRPQFFEIGLTNALQEKADQIRNKYLTDEAAIQLYTSKIEEFSEIQKKIARQKELDKKAQEEAKLLKEQKIALHGENNKKKQSKNKKEQQIEADQANKSASVVTPFLENMIQSQAAKQAGGTGQQQKQDHQKLSSQVHAQFIDQSLQSKRLMQAHLPPAAAVNPAHAAADLANPQQMRKLELHPQQDPLLKFKQPAAEITAFASAEQKHRQDIEPAKSARLSIQSQPMQAAKPSAPSDFADIVRQQRQFQQAQLAQMGRVTLPNVEASNRVASTSKLHMKKYPNLTTFLERKGNDKAMAFNPAPTVGKKQAPLEKAAVAPIPPLKYKAKSNNTNLNIKKPSQAPKTQNQARASECTYKPVDLRFARPVNKGQNNFFRQLFE